MADFIATNLFKCTIGWLINKARTVAGRNLRHGDVIDQLLCDLVSPELESIKSKLDGLAQQHLGAAISSYNEGVGFTTEEEEPDGPGPAKRMKLDAKDAKDRFKNAREEASRAFHNPELQLEKRILAVYIRVMAIMRENADDPARALGPCKQYIDEMHGLEEVRKNVKLLQSQSPLKILLPKQKLRDIILSVYALNRMVFGITQMIGVGNHFFVWPTVDCGDRKIDPLRDSSFSQVLQGEGRNMDVQWTFHEQDEQAENRLIRPHSIATNTKEEYLVVDNTDIKVFDCNGRFQKSLSGLLGDRKFPADYHPVDIETDQNGKVYLLVQMANNSHAEGWYEVVVLDNDSKLHTFPLRNKSRGRKLAVNQHGDNTEVLLLEGQEDLHAMVEVYGTDGMFVCQFGERILQNAQDIIGANDGHVYVLDKCHESEKKFIREFDARRNQLRRFNVAPDCVAIAFHRPSKHMVVVSSSNSRELKLAMYLKDNLVHTQNLNFLLADGDLVNQDVTVTVTVKGRIVVGYTVNISGKQQGNVTVY